MLISALYWVDRLRCSRARADEVREVRRRLAAQTCAPAASDQEVRFAHDLRRLREALSEAFAGSRACSRCVRPRSLTWPGGHCCSGHTADLFTDHELAALELSGTTPAYLRPPRGEHAGCAFRAPEGCWLEPAHRPCLCVSYACLELEQEVRARVNGRAIARLRSELRRSFEQFVAHRLARLECEQLAAFCDPPRRTRDALTNARPRQRG